MTSILTYYQKNKKALQGKQRSYYHNNRDKIK